MSHSRDILIRLRELQGGAHQIMPNTVKEAADEIEQLREENAKLKADILQMAERIAAQSELLSKKAAKQ